MSQVRDSDGPWLPEAVPPDGRPAGPGADRDSLYAGIGGLAPVLAEIGPVMVAHLSFLVSGGTAAWRFPYSAGCRARSSRPPRGLLVRSSHLAVPSHLPPRGVFGPPTGSLAAWSAPVRAA